MQFSNIRTYIWSYVNVNANERRHCCFVHMSCNMLHYKLPPCCVNCHLGGAANYPIVKSSHEQFQHENLLCAVSVRTPLQMQNRDNLQHYRLHDTEVVQIFCAFHLALIDIFFNLGIKNIFVFFKAIL